MRSAIPLLILLLLIPLASTHSDSAISNEARILLPVGTVAGESIPVAFLFTDPETEQPITRLDVTHERVLHVLLASDDLVTFAHLHPEDFPDGLRYESEGQRHVFLTFPHPGKYAIAIDYAIAGESHEQVFPVIVPGDVPPLVPLDFTREQTVGQYRVTLDAPATIRAGSATRLEFTVTRDGVAVTDLEPYLGEAMHLFFINDALNRSAHLHPGGSHPADEDVGRGAQEDATGTEMSGPAIPFRATFPDPGAYALYAQFQHAGEVVPVVFHIQVAPARALPLRALLIGAIALGALLVGRWAWRFFRT